MTELKVSAPAVDRDAEILTDAARNFLGQLHVRFAARRNELLAARVSRREEIRRDRRLDFLPETASIRGSDWRVPPAPADLADRRVEITGPTERKMSINALNSGAQVWLADLEDANTPHWRNVVGGQINLLDAVRGTISLAGDTKQYELRSDQRLATIVVRPRGWHLDERHVTVDGRTGVGALVDFGLYFFHNAAELLARGSGPYFYLPKMESHLEARLWHDVFVFAEQYVGVPQGSIRATALIETIPAAYEMDEILYELGEHAAGLNAGRWDYLFSIIKKFRDCGPSFMLPDRASVTMAAPFMHAYADLLVHTCHRRGAHAIGGMAAFIPSRHDAEVNERAFAKVREDKAREAHAGFDGSWVAHPDLVAVCAEMFERTNQLDVLRDDVVPDADALLDLPSGPITETGVRTNVEVPLRYLSAWLGGNGAVAIHNLMEDAATVEISRSQLWQWVHNGAVLDDGRTITADLVRDVLREESDAIRAEVGDDAWTARHYVEAAQMFEQIALADDFADFLTIAAYKLID